MLSWEWPWVFILLPLPLLIRWLLPAGDAAPQAIRVPFFDQLRQLHEQTEKSAIRVWLQITLAALIWLSLLIAAARPTWVGDPVPIPQDLSLIHI